MKKIIALVLALTLAFSMVVFFTSCGNKGEETTTAATEETQEETTEATSEEETTEDANLPKSGETLTFGTAKVTIPEGWVVAEYEEGKKVELNPADDTFPSVEINLHEVYDNNHAKEWADNINGNYGGKCKIDQVKIGGKDFYRVEGDTEQHVCFADLDDSTYLEVSVMFMPWDDGAPVLNAITIG